MKNVIYRELIKDDYERIKELICEAFGFGDFIKDKNFLDSLLTMYLQGCILDSSFSKVAVLNNRVIGIILGDAKKDSMRLKKTHNKLSALSNIIKIVFTNSENKKALKEFIKIQKIYKEIIKGKKDNFQGCVQLFIVSKEARGFGVGKNLMNYLFDYMNTMSVKSMYLYTDTRCNYGFYDSQNFNRINEKEILFESFNEKLNIFLYSYDF